MAAAARRALWRLRAAVLAALASALLLSPIAGSASEPVDIGLSLRVEHEGDAHVIFASLVVPVAPLEAWAVLTDFDHMASFIPDVTSSRVVRRDGATLLVIQRGHLGFGSLRFAFESTRSVELAPPGMIRSTQVRGSLRSFRSATQIEAVAAGTRLDYRVEIVPAAWMPASITDSLLLREVESQFQALAREMIRRKG